MPYRTISKHRSSGGSLNAYALMLCSLAYYQRQGIQVDNYQAYWLEQQRLRNAPKEPVKPIEDGRQTKQSATAQAR